jgi:hypothetical protein
MARHYNQTPIQNQKLPARAIAERYGVTTRTIDRWILSGALPQPAFKINGVRYWDQADVEAFDNHRSQSENSSQAA